MPTAAQLVTENLVFFGLTLPGLAWGVRRYAGLRQFTGPRTPWPAWFRAWFKVIWAVGIALPLGVVVVLAVQGRGGLAALALGPYFAMFVVQIATEQACIALRSPVWVAVPCFYLPWRLVQLERGLDVAAGEGALINATLWALIVLWVINIWVHYSGMPNQMRWDELPAGDSSR